MQVTEADEVYNLAAQSFVGVSFDQPITTAMGQAYADSIPMLVIFSVQSRSQLGGGRGKLHKLPDQGALVAGVAAFSHTLMSAVDPCRAVLHGHANDPLEQRRGDDQVGFFFRPGPGTDCAGF